MFDEEQIASLTSNINEMRRLKYNTQDEIKKNEYAQMEERLCQDYRNLTGYDYNQILYIRFNHNLMEDDILENPEIKNLVNIMGGFIRLDENNIHRL